MALLRNDPELIDPRAPERSHLALSRLIPWLRGAGDDDSAVEMRFYTKRKGQNPREIHIASLLYFLTWTLLLYDAVSQAILIRPLLVPLVAALTMLFAPVVMLVIMATLEPLVRWLLRRFPYLSKTSIHSTFQQVILFVLCLEAALDSHWIRWVGIAWITAVGLELLARTVELAWKGKKGEEPFEN